MSWKLPAFAGLLIVVTSPAFAVPTLTVANGGLVGGNQQWLISVTPDVATFVPNTSLAVELDFTFHGTINSFTLDNTFWNKSTVNNVGNNPFTGTVTGTQVDNTPANDTLFVAAGSELYSNGDVASSRNTRHPGLRRQFWIGVVTGAERSECLHSRANRSEWREYQRYLGQPTHSHT